MIEGGEDRQMDGRKEGGGGTKSRELEVLVFPFTFLSFLLTMRFFFCRVIVFSGSKSLHPCSL